jgi:hypothetical protein
VTSYIDLAMADGFKSDVKLSIKTRQPGADFEAKMMDWAGISELSQVTFPRFAWIALRWFTDCSAWPH